MTTIKLDDLIITVTERQPDGGYTAWLGDYDLGCMTGWGKTVFGAASDLLEKENEARLDRLARMVDPFGAPIGVS